MAKLELKKITGIPIIAIAAASALLAIVVLAALLMRPVADDFAYFSDPYVSNPIGFAIHYYLDWTGRFSQAIWMSSLFRLFGKDVVIYGTILQLLILVLASVGSSYTILKKLRLSHSWRIAVGFAIATLAVYMTKSFFDTNLWITSSTVYIGSAIGLLFAITATGFLLNLSKKNVWYLIGLFVVVFLAQLFSEPTSIITVYFAALAILVNYLFIKNKVAISTLWVAFAGSIAGFIFMLLAPGTLSRQDKLEGSSSLIQSLLSALGDFEKILPVFTSYRLLLIILFALILAPILVDLSKRTKIILLSVASLSAFVVPLILLFTTHYTLAGYTPGRAYTVPFMLLGACLVIMTSTGLSLLPKTSLKKYPYNPLVITPALVVLALFTSIQVMSATAPTLQAVAQRTALYDLREDSIIKQLSGNSGQVEITPLPLLLTTTDATDLYYNAGTPAWLEESFKDYYRIPDSSEVIKESQPEGYCVTKDNPYWFGTKSCEELDD